MVAGKRRVGNKQKREREEQIKGVRGRVWERTRNGIS